jgi:hypothetical protein
LKPVKGSVPVVPVPETLDPVASLLEPTDALEAEGEEVDGAELLEDEGDEDTLLALEEEPLPADEEPDEEPWELPEPELELPELPEPELELPELPEPEPELELPSGLTYC